MNCNARCVITLAGVNVTCNLVWDVIHSFMISVPLSPTFMYSQS